MLRRGRWRWWGLALAVPLSLAAGCAGPYAEHRDEIVTRRFGDDLVDGPYVSPSAYEHYILAMLREDAGRPDEAVEELRRAIGADGGSAYLRVRLADALLSTGRIDEARDELDAAQKLEADDADAWIVRARLESRLGRHAAVEAALDKAIALDPTLEEGYLMLAAAQRDAGHDDRALATMRALAAHVASATAEEALGRAALTAGDRAAARKHLARAIDLDASRNDARVELARTALGDGDADLGLRLLESAAERTREPGLSLELARSAALAGRHAQALAVLDRLEEDAQSAAARLDVAQSFLVVGVPRRAATIAESVLADSKRADVRAAAHALLARAATSEGELDRALTEWQAIGEGDEQRVEAVLARARILRERGHEREAVALVEDAMKQRVAYKKLDDRDQLAAGLASLRVDMGAGAEAVDKLEALSAQRPHALSMRLELARLERQVARPDKAIAILEPLARKHELRAMQLLADTLVGAGQRLDEAQRLLTRALGMAPHDASIAVSAGLADVALGRYDDARRLLERADRLAPPNVDALVALAKLYERADRHDDAVAVLRRALGARPDEHRRQEIEAQLIMIERGRMGAR
jgi:tetratricopeptide (TPR) repeat protein